MTRNAVRHGTGLLAFVLAAAVGLLASPAQAHPITFTNQSSDTIMEFYFDEDWRDSWTDDMLGEYVLYPGGSVELSHGDYCQWHIRLVLEDGSDLRFEEDIDFCAITEIYLYCNEQTCWLDSR